MADDADDATTPLRTDEADEATLRRVRQAVQEEVRDRLSRVDDDIQAAENDYRAERWIAAKGLFTDVRDRIRRLAERRFKLAPRGGSWANRRKRRRQLQEIRRRVRRIDRRQRERRALREVLAPMPRRLAKGRGKRGQDGACEFFNATDDEDSEGYDPTLVVDYRIMLEDGVVENFAARPDSAEPRF